MVKFAFIVLSLVGESEKQVNEEIEKEIYDELEADLASRIPWVKKVEKVTVLGETNGKGETNE